MNNMITHIRIKYVTTNGSNVMQQGEFRVNNRAINTDPERALTQAAYDFLKQIKKEISVDKVLSVIVDNQFDLTDLVIALDKSLLP